MKIYVYDVDFESRYNLSKISSTELQLSRYSKGFSGDTVVNTPPANARDARDAGLIIGSGRYPWRRACNPLQYSCLENSMDRGAWRGTVHGLTQTWTC